MRRVVYDQLETESRRQKGLSAANRVLVLVILSSIVLYTLETEVAFRTGQGGIFVLLNNVFLWVFAAEFVLRLWSAGAEARFGGRGGLWAYVKANRFMLAVDFIAFAPELLCFLAVPSPPSFLRSFRVIRLLKIARYFPAFRLVLDALRSCYRELLVALSLSTALWYLSSVVLYACEGEAQPEKFGSIVRAMWWGVATLTTVGYGDVYPETAVGKVAAGLFAVVGIGTVALPSGILAGAFIEQYRTRRQARAAETGKN
ncbi:ion transporter [Oleispirillum naphthae]|uniref:ion transporter n=1 Tax=Oleispirillum naphthae TaxID=2838853 RepID=UPI0030826590